MIAKEELRAMVRGAYDCQKLRIQAGNRVARQIRAKLEGAGEDDVDRVLKLLTVDYRRITDGLVGLPRRTTFRGQGIINNYTELALVDLYMGLLKAETRNFRHLTSLLEEHVIYTGWLKEVKGVGPALAGVLISELDPHKAPYPSSFWKYAGLDVAQDGQGRSRKKEHLIDAEYTDRNGEQATRKSITFNPFLKTKLTGVLGPSFLRAKSPYADEYYNYKLRLENSPAHQEKTKGHRHNMAIRYMIKRFLVDLHVTWRRLEGLPVSEEYSAAKLGIVHRAA